MLDDHFSNGDKLRPKADFEKYRDTIEGLARRKYLRGQLEVNKTVALRRKEIS